MSVSDRNVVMSASVWNIVMYKIEYCNVYMSYVNHRNISVSVSDRNIGLSVSIWNIVVSV